jgi:hypothetical protein
MKGKKHHIKCYPANIQKKDMEERTLGPMLG